MFLSISLRWLSRSALAVDRRVLASVRRLDSADLEEDVEEPGKKDEKAVGAIMLWSTRYWRKSMRRASSQVRTVGGR